MNASGGIELGSAFLLGLVGSLHCAGMCGALALAMPATGETRRSFFAGRAAYNLGRIATYCGLGVVFGYIGRNVALAGFQRWASLLAGSAILATCLFSARYGLAVPLSRGVAWLKSQLSVQLRRRTLSSSFLLGALNGLLPCGLVYVACTASVVTGGILNAVAYMFLFGLGTVPLMLGIGIAGRNVQLAIRLRYQKLIPICLVMVGALLVLRGLALGIPYLSPDLAATHASCH